MKTSMFRRLLACTVAMTMGALPPHAWPITVAATGNYAQTVTSADLTGGAGTDFTNPYASGTTATQLSISATVNKFDAWRIDVRRVDSTWNASLVLQVKRADNGSQCGNKGGNPSGGTAYQTVTTTDTTFFSGAGDRCSIGVQYQLSGISVSIAAGTYSTTVMYTLVNI